MDTVHITHGDDSDEIVCTGSSCLDQTTASNEMHIKFVSDHVTTDVGFRAEVIAVPNDPCYCSELYETQLTSPDETFSLKSPNYPKPYCSDRHRVCGWKIKAPVGYGLNVQWLEFEIQQGTDLVEIDDGLVEKWRCTGIDCDDIVGIGEEIELCFHSNVSQSESTGFHALVSVIKPYCDKTDHLVSRASVSYSSEIADGHASHGGVASLTCDPGMKIAGSEEDATDTATCVAPNWNKPLANCIPGMHHRYSASIPISACSLNITPIITSNENAHLCEIGSQPAPSLVTDGNSITVKHIDIRNSPGQRLNTDTYTCQYHTWIPNAPPTCHRIGILIIGGWCWSSCLGP